MLSKKELKAITHCKSQFCKECCVKPVDCDNDNVAQTALQLLERVETAEQIFKDILSSGSIAACKSAMLRFLEGKE